MTYLFTAPYRPDEHCLVTKKGYIPQTGTAILQFAIVLLVLWQSPARALDIGPLLNTCPQRDPVYSQIRSDFEIRRNGVPVGDIPCSEPISQLPIDQYTDEIIVEQGLRAVFYTELDSTSLPWAPGMTLYKWMKSKMAGINISDTAANSSCCEILDGKRFFTLNAQNDPNRDFDREWRGISGNIALYAHELRHLDNFPHVSCCGIQNGCDQTYDETNLSPYGIQWWLNAHWLTGDLYVGFSCLDQTQINEIADWHLGEANRSRVNRFCDNKPPVLMRPAVPGGQCRSAAGVIDLFMLVDLSGSFADDLPKFKDQAPRIISTLKASNPDIRFGLARFEDYPISPFGSAGDQAYQRLIDLTFDTDRVLKEISRLFVRDGADEPQSQLAALFQAATGAGQNVLPGASIPPGQQANFRNGATKLFLIWTDAEFHRPGDAGDIPYPGPGFDQTIDAIRALDPPQVIGISSGTTAISDLEAIAEATNALAPLGGVDCDDDGNVDVLGGEPLVCGIASSGRGIGRAVIAVVEAAMEPISCGGINATVVGTGGSDDLLIGTAGKDVIQGLSGNDIIKGLRGKDAICGGRGIDMLNGGRGPDLLRGGRGNDWLAGKRGDDRLFGQRGNDTLDGGAGADLCDGGRGQDSGARCEQVRKVP